MNLTGKPGRGQVAAGAALHADDLEAGSACRSQCERRYPGGIHQGLLRRRRPQEGQRRIDQDQQRGPRPGRLLDVPPKRAARVGLCRAARREDLLPAQPRLGSEGRSEGPAPAQEPCRGKTDRPGQCARRRMDLRPRDRERRLLRRRGSPRDLQLPAAASSSSPARSPGTPPRSSTGWPRSCGSATSTPNATGAMPRTTSRRCG